MRVVLDTNILVSAALAQREERWSATRWLVEVALIAQRRYEHVTSEPIMHELQSVLQRHMTLEAADTFVDAVWSNAAFTRIFNVPMGVRDPRDDKIVETAMNANADGIVSRDRDLHDARACYAISKTGVGIRDRPILVWDVAAFTALVHGGPPFSPLVSATLAA